MVGYGVRRSPQARGTIVAGSVDSGRASDRQIPRQSEYSIQRGTRIGCFLFFFMVVGSPKSSKIMIFCLYVTFRKQRLPT